MFQSYADRTVKGDLKATVLWLLVIHTKDTLMCKQSHFFHTFFPLEKCTDYLQTHQAHYHGSENLAE